MLPDRPVPVRAEEVLLRAYVPSDAADLLEAFADPLVRTWNPGPTDEAGVREFMAARNDWSEGRHASWAIADAGTGRLLGAVSLHQMDLEKGESELGYWVAPWARGRGVASTAALRAARYGFDDLGLRRVFCFHAVENTGSCGGARRAGFLHEGTLRQSYKYADGRWHDEHLHARLAGD